MQRLDAIQKSQNPAVEKSIARQNLCSRGYGSAT
jgi:hypothetical protein